VRIHIVFISAVALVGLAFTTPAFADTTLLSTLDLVGTSTFLKNGTGTLRLTNNTVVTGPPSPAGAAWTPTQYNVAAPFSANFQFQFTDPCLNGLTGNPPCANDNGHGGDGIAFLIQNSPQGTSAIGVGAGGMGFLGIPDSVAVMLDTYQNASPPYYGDPSNNYIAINTRGSSFNVPQHFCTKLKKTGAYELTASDDLPSDLFSPYCTADPTLAMTSFVTGKGPKGSMPGVVGFPALKVDMDNGDVYDLEVVYTGSVLDIYLDSKLVLAAYIDLAAEVGGPDAYLGFTAGTQNAFQNQDILSFSETTIPEPAWGQLWVPLTMILAAALARRWRRSKV